MGRAYKIRIPFTEFGKRLMKELMEELVKGKYKQIERISESNDLRSEKIVVIEVR